MSATTNRSAAEVGRTRWTRLIPIAIIVYIISFMDRTNIGFAFDGLHDDLGIDATQQGLAAGDLLHRLSGPADPRRPPGRALERQEVRRDHDPGLGRASRSPAGFVQTFAQLLVVRFFLGVAEAGIWPAILVLISHWFPAAERARAYGVLDDEHRDLLDHHRAAVGLDPHLSPTGAGCSSSRAPSRSWSRPRCGGGSWPTDPREARWCSAEEREYIETVAGRATNAATRPVGRGCRDVFRSSVVLAPGRWSTSSSRSASTA